MVDLSVEIAGVQFKNPVWLSSGEPTWGFERMKRGIDAGAGGIVAKSLNIPPPEIRGAYQGKRIQVFDEIRELVRGGKIPRFFTLYYRAIRPGFPDDEDKWIADLEKSEKYAIQHDTHVIGSLTTMAIEDERRIARKMEQIGLKMIEVDAGCPHFDDFRGDEWGTDKLLTARTMNDLVSKVKPITEVVSIPVIVKLSPMAYADLVSMTRWSIEKCGAVGVTCHNRFMGLMIDIETGKPFLQSYASVGGPWMLPLSLRWVGKIHQALPKVPIFGSSGAFDWKDVAAFLMAGSCATQFCSAVGDRPLAECRRAHQPHRAPHRHCGPADRRARRSLHHPARCKWRAVGRQDRPRPERRWPRLVRRSDPTRCLRIHQPEFGRVRPLRPVQRDRARGRPRAGLPARLGGVRRARGERGRRLADVRGAGR